MEKNEPTSIAGLRPWQRNPREIDQPAASGLRASLERFGDISGITYNTRTQRLVCGHQRVQQLRGMGGQLVRIGDDAFIRAPERSGGVALHRVRFVDWDEDTETQANLAANNEHIAGKFTEELGVILGELQERDPEAFEELRLEPLAGQAPGAGDSSKPYGEPTEEQKGALARAWGVPPTTMLRADSPAWLDRKRYWREAGLLGEAGREDVVLYRVGLSGAAMPTVSIIDPVLCEIMYRWFCPPGGLVINPTAGGPVSGVVAAMQGYRFQGVEVRGDQVQVNTAFAAQMNLPSAQWIHGDGCATDQLVGQGVADFILCCPPYYDLEVYSDQPDDISTASSYADFVQLYSTIIGAACRSLRMDRFACFVVGEVRGAAGEYVGLIPDTIRAFQAAGLRYYNEAVLATPQGTAALRAGGQMRKSRKLCKVHQNVLIFVKGDERRAAELCATIEDEEFNADGAGGNVAGAQTVGERG